MCQFAGMVQSREPLVDDVIWFMTAILWSVTCSLRFLGSWANGPMKARVLDALKKRVNISFNQMNTVFDYK